MFALHPRLAADTLWLGDLPLCRVLLASDARYPWLILVPRREGISELHALMPADRALLMEESCGVAQAMERELKAHKMNVAALGNVVPQLHLHHVARFRDDDAWPGPIWGAHPPLEKSPADQRARRERMHALLAQIPGFTSAL